MRLVRRKHGVLFLVGVVGVGVVVWLWASWRTDSVEERLQAGLEALERGAAHEAEREAAQLERDGHAQPARLIRGRRLFLEGEARMREAARLARQDRTAQGAEFLLGHAALAGRATATPPVMLLGVASMQFRPALAVVLEVRFRSHAAFAQAHAELSRIREGSKLWPRAAEYDARSLFYLGELRAAAALLAQLVEQTPDHADTHRLLAILYYDLGAMEQAIAHAETLARLEPENGQPHRLIGMINRDYYQVAAAVEAYRAALTRRLEPLDRVEVARQLAELLIDQLSKYEEALDAIRQAPADFQQQPEMLALRGECLWNLQRRGPARADIERALERDPELPRALRVLGQVELDEERPGRAIVLLEKAVQLDPHDHKNRDRLAAAYRQTGRQESAEEQERARDQLMARKEELTQLNRDALLRPFDDQVRLQIARTWLELDRPREARMWLRAAVACNPKNEPAQELLRRLGGP